MSPQQKSNEPDVDVRRIENTGRNPHTPLADEAGVTAGVTDTPDAEVPPAVDIDQTNDPSKD